MTETGTSAPPATTSWRQPTGEPARLHVYNSLTKTKVPFHPAKDNHVKWYTCGPTVYDASHMGHARNYVGLDLCRRIMQGYFGYEVTLCMNITDIDDKIIMRANERNIPFTQLAQTWEDSFMEDMAALNVQPPEVLTRVSEYVPEIVTYIAKLIDNGFAYESNGSVYFDTVTFQKDHEYAKLSPNAKGNLKLADEGEGALSVGASDKRSPFDFALWKKSKPAEPSWPSPWGEGRPGWHIECSVMASAILGQELDIHSGGEDLKFPHHDNELAQAEGFFKHQQWVNYFIHSGHLHIEGLKMAKSLKNFITIKEALSKYSARQIRMLFLLHRNDLPMDFSDDSMNHALDRDRLFAEFAHEMRVQQRQHKARTERQSQHWSADDMALNSTYEAEKHAVHNALADNFDTPTVMDALQRLVRAVHKYLELKQKESLSPMQYLLASINAYITRLFKIFGLIDEASSGDANGETIVAPFLDAFCSFRDQVRAAARAKDTTALLELCDRVRDDTMPLLGVRLEDRPGASIWKLDDKEQLLRERQQMLDVAAARELARAEAERKRREREELSKLKPELMFTQGDAKLAYSLFDDKGVPTHDAAGTALTKSAIKKLQKEWDTQKKLHDKYLQTQQAPTSTEAATPAAATTDAAASS